PKGGANDGETPLEAARRELYEETNIVLNPDNIISVYDLGVHEYYSSKDLHIIVTFLKEKPVDLKCNAFFTINDIKVPEVYDFKWVTLSDSKNYLFKSLYKTISGVYPT
ncbi:MAG: NUDIX hydrolase, partial [Candidatus Pacearchaeota archaeon]